MLIDGLEVSFMLLACTLGYTIVQALDPERRKIMLQTIKRLPKAMGCFMDALVGNALDDPQNNDIANLQKQLDQVERRRQEDLEAKIRELEICAKKEGLAQQEIEELKRAAEEHAAEQKRLREEDAK